MTQWYVDGVNGNNGNNGTTPALAKATLTAVEALALAAGDTVNVRPTVYRETLTTSHNGSAGNPITYLVDEGGAIFGVRGKARITGSDNDATITRASAIVCANNFRVFRGFHVHATSTQGVYLNNCTNCEVDRCTFTDHIGTLVVVDGATQSNHLIHRCKMWCVKFGGVSFSHTVTLNNTGHITENCDIIATNAGSTSAISTARVAGLTVRNCNILGGVRGVQVATALAGGQSINVNNCQFAGLNICFAATIAGEIIENFNNLFGNYTDRSNTNVGANSVSKPPLWQTNLLTLGNTVLIPEDYDPLSAFISIAGTGVAADDIYGTTRLNPSSWGSYQYVQGALPVDAGTGFMIKVDDIGKVTIVGAINPSTQAAIITAVQQALKGH